MIIAEFNDITRQYMDYSDMKTIHLLKEADDNQERILSALTSKLYDKIQEKADKIDFSSISRSRGDITKIEKYDSLMECLDILRNIVVQYKEDTYPIDVVSTAVSNIKDRTALFKKAFAIGSPILTLTYNTITLAIVQSVSFLIATCVEYVADPKTDSFQMALDIVAYSKTEENLLFENLSAFNESCKSGEFDQAADVALKQSKIKHESAELDADIAQDTPFLTDTELLLGQEPKVIHDEKIAKKKELQREAGLIVYGVSRALAFIAKLLIPMIRSLVYFFFSTKQKMSDYYGTQADLIEMNAYKLQYESGIDEKKKQAIIAKQLKIAQRMRHKQNVFSVDYSVSRKNTEKMVAADASTKYTADDIARGDDSEESDNSAIF